MKCLFLCLSFLILLNCSNKNYEKTISKGIIIHNNRNTPSNLNFKIKLEKKFTVNSAISENVNISSPLYPVVSDNNNLFIVDVKTQKIYKFNIERGYYLKSFGGKGNGPGEFINIINQYIKKDTLFVFDSANRSINKFSLDGIFINKTKCSKLKETKKFRNKNFISSTLKSNYNEKKLTLTGTVVLEDNNFKKIKTLAEATTSSSFSNLDINMLDIAFHVAVSKFKIFIGRISTTTYKIDVYNKEFLKTEEIRKNYTSKKLDTKVKNNLSKIPLVKGIKINLSDKYQKSINGIWVDKFERIWVLSGQNQKNNEVYFDIFKNGIYLNSIKFDEINFIIDHNASAYLIFSKNYLIVKNPESMTMTVYNYN